MNALPKKLLPLILFGIAVTSLFFVQPVQGFTVTLEQMGASSATWNNATFTSLGVTPGTCVWSWGDGANQRFTLRIGVPDGGSTVSLLGCALFGLAALRRKLSC